MRITFDSCIPEETLRQLAPYVLPAYEALSELAPWVRDWPTHIECMDAETIIYSRKRGAGHGQYSPDQRRIWVNPYMTAYGIFLNILHENCHHAFADATEMEINNLLVPHLAEQVLGHPIDLDEARMHGLGPAVKGIPGRGYAGT